MYNLIKQLLLLALVSLCFVSCKKHTLVSYLPALNCGSGTLISTLADVSSLDGRWKIIERHQAGDSLVCCPGSHVANIWVEYYTDSLFQDSVSQKWLLPTLKVYEYTGIGSLDSITYNTIIYDDPARFEFLEGPGIPAIMLSQSLTQIEYCANEYRTFNQDSTLSEYAIRD